MAIALAQGWETLGSVSSRAELPLWEWGLHINPSSYVPPKQASGLGGPFNNMAK